MASLSAKSRQRPAAGRLRRNWVRYRWQVTALAAVASVVLGMIGIGQLNSRISIIDRLYGTIELFSFGYSPGQQNVPPLLEIARFVAPLTVAYAGFRAIASIFVQQWTEFRVQGLFRDHVVVCGLGRAGLRFALSFRDRGVQVVAIEQQPSATVVDECRKHSIPLIVGDATDRLILAKAGVGRASHLVAACGDDAANGDVALIVQTQFTARRRPLQCFVHISDDRLCALLEEAVLLAPSSELVHIEYFNIYRTGPRALLNAHGLAVPSQLAPHYVVVGDGEFSLNLVVEAARRWHLEAGSDAHLRITLVAPDAGSQIDDLLRRYPSLSRSCTVAAWPGDLSDPECPPLQLPTDVAASALPSVAFVCQADDTAGLRAAIRLRRSLDTAVPIVVCTTNRASSVTELLSEAGSNVLPNVWSFEVLEQVCTPEVLLNGTREVLAQAFHANYVAEQLARGADPASESMRPWESLAETYRRANRDLAFSVGPKLQAVHCALTPLPDWDTSPLVFDDAEVETLARLEHERWCRDRVADGWVYAPVMDRAGKRHTDLRPWEQLDEEVKQKDRDAVRVIPRLLATYAGFGIVRQRPSEPPTPPPTAPARVGPTGIDVAG